MVPTGQGKVEKVVEFCGQGNVREKYYFWKV